MKNAGLNSKRPVAIVVDTDPLTRWALAHYLGRWIEVRTANSLTEARTLLKELAPAAVICMDPGISAKWRSGQRAIYFALSFSTASRPMVP